MERKALIEQRNVIASGYLDLKPPSGSPNRKLWKAWQNCWVVAKVDTSSNLEPTLELQLSQFKEDTQHQTIKIPRDNLRLFRGRSRSKPLRTWGLASKGTALLYLAAESEAETQLWMERIRDAIWPPELTSQIRSVTSDAHKVSLLDNEHSYRAGLLGAYGQLILAADRILTLVHPHWGTDLLKCPIDNIKEVHLLREAKSDHFGSGVFTIRMNRGTEGSNFNFYSQTAVQTTHWIAQELNRDKQNQNNYFSKDCKYDKTVTDLTDVKTNDVIQFKVKDSLPHDKMISKNSETNDTIKDLTAAKDSPEYMNMNTDELNDRMFNKTIDTNIAALETYDVPPTRQRISDVSQLIENHAIWTNSHPKKEHMDFVKTFYAKISKREELEPIQKFTTEEAYDVPQVRKTIDTFVEPNHNTQGYAIIQKKQTIVDSCLEEKRSTLGSCLEFGDQNLFQEPNINCDLLDARACSSFSKQSLESRSSTSSTNSDLCSDSEEEDHFYESINTTDHRKTSIVSNIYEEIAVRGSVGAQTIYEYIEDDEYVPPLPRRRIIFSESFSNPPPETKPRTASILRLEKLSNNVEEILKQMGVDTTM